jgi:hypothetical protein
VSGAFQTWRKVPWKISQTVQPQIWAKDREAFWRTDSALLEQRLVDPALRQAAFEELTEETTRLPVYYQKSLELLGRTQ